MLDMMKTWPKAVKTCYQKQIAGEVTYSSGRKHFTGNSQ